jgi:hypothetical protein
MLTHEANGSARELCSRSGGLSLDRDDRNEVRE